MSVVDRMPTGSRRWWPSRLGARLSPSNYRHRRIMPGNKMLSGLALLFCSPLMANGRYLGQAHIARTCLVGNTSNTRVFFSKTSEHFDFQSL